MASDTYHEPLELLSGETREMHRAIVSLMEELEAIDWYQQPRRRVCRSAVEGRAAAQQERRDRARDDGHGMDPPSQ